MGTNTNQIATRADINSGKRKVAYNHASTYIGMSKCPTKGEINQIEFLNVENKPTTAITEDTYWDMGLANWSSGSIHLETYGASTLNRYVSGGTPITPSNYENYPMIIPNPSTRYYHSSVSQLFNISFTGEIDDIDFYDFNNVKANALCYKTISVTPGKYTNLRIDHAVIAYANTSSAQSNYSISKLVTPQNDGKSFEITIALVDSNSEVIYLTDVDNYVGIESIADISFTPTTSSITIYIIPRYIDVSFYPSIAGNLYVGVGFNLGVRKIIYDSYYDSISKLAQYEDIGKDSARTFEVYVGVWNNKSSKADLEYARVYINTSNSHTASGWTQIGSATLGSVSSTTTKLITCTLPDSVNLGTTQYYLMIEVGATTFKQTWAGGWGSTYNTTTYSNYTNGDGYRGRTPIIPLTPNTTNVMSVLNRIKISSLSGESESTTVIKGEYNANPEFKGWIKIT